MKQLLIAFTFLLVFTVSLTPAALGADYPPSPSKSEDTNPSKNPIDEIKKIPKMKIIMEKVDTTKELHMKITMVDLMEQLKQNQLRCGFVEIIPLEV